MASDPKHQDENGDLDKTKRIMERLVRMPPKPHKPKRDEDDEKQRDRPSRPRKNEAP